MSINYETHCEEVGRDKYRIVRQIRITINNGVDHIDLECHEWLKSGLVDVVTVDTHNILASKQVGMLLDWLLGPRDYF